MQRFDNIQAIAIRQAQIYDGETRRLFAHFGNAFGNRVSHAHHKATGFHCAPQPVQHQPVMNLWDS